MAGGAYGTFYNGSRKQYTFGIKYRAQPWGNFSINMEQNFLEFPEPYGSDKLFLINPRMEINFSRKLFWTSFLQYNTQEDNFNINSRIQWVKRMACGYRNRENFRHAIYFHLGGLDLYPEALKSAHSKA